MPKLRCSECCHEWIGELTPENLRSVSCPNCGGTAADIAMIVDPPAAPKPAGFWRRLRDFFRW